MIYVSDIETLCDILAVALPYEYDEHYDRNTETLEITKEGSDIVAYVTEDETEPGVIDVTSYIVENDGLPLCEGIRFDMADPDFDLLDAVDWIKRLF